MNIRYFFTSDAVVRDTGVCCVGNMHLRGSFQNHFGPYLESPDFPKMSSVQRAWMLCVRKMSERDSVIVINKLIQTSAMYSTRLRSP